MKFDGKKMRKSNTIYHHEVTQLVNTNLISDHVKIFQASWVVEVYWKIHLQADSLKFSLKFNEAKWKFKIKYQIHK